MRDTSQSAFICLNDNGLPQSLLIKPVRSHYGLNKNPSIKFEYSKLRAVQCNEFILEGISRTDLQIKTDRIT